MSCYEALAGAYDVLTEDVGYGKRLDFIEKLLCRSRIPVKLVLDLACGTGTMSWLLTQQGYEVIGVDGSEDMLAAAMGKSGTEVAKQAADVILLDDNLSTLVYAVEQGRCIYANIRKFVRYLLSCNIGEVITMLLGILMGMPVILLPTQLLLVNLVTDGLPAIALGMEQPEPDAMRQPPRKPEEPFFSGGLLQRIVFRGLLIGVCTLGAFSMALRLGGTLEAARTTALCTLILSQLIHVFECKSETKSLFHLPLWNNWKLLAAVAVSAGILFAAVESSALQMIFTTVPLSLPLWIVVAISSCAIPICSAILFQITAKKKGGQ